MPKFSKRSLKRLHSCDPRLQMLFAVVVQHFDCSILEGHRSNKRQGQLLEQGKTTLGPGKSRHNVYPSMAVDVAPYPVDWDDRERFYYFAGFVKGTARQMDLEVRWGGDWDSDYDLHDQTFNDLPHFEIIS